MFDTKEMDEFLKDFEPGLYKHYKGWYYILDGFCIAYETGEICMLYRDKIVSLPCPWIRKWKSWKTPVDGKPRFTPVESIQTGEIQEGKEDIAEKFKSVMDINEKMKSILKGMPERNTIWAAPDGKTYRLMYFLMWEDSNEIAYKMTSLQDPPLNWAVSKDTFKTFTQVTHSLKEEDAARKRKREEESDEVGPPKLKVKRVVEDVPLPCRATKSAGGYDLYSPIDCAVPAHGMAKLPLGICVQFPKGYVGIIKIRSSLGKEGLDTGAGVIDQDYRGVLSAIIFNHGDDAYIIREHDRIVQLLLLRNLEAEVEEVEELDPTERGEGGFGSTGKGSEVINH